MQGFLFFIADKILGYFLQSTGFILSLDAFTHKKIKPLEFLLTNIVFAFIAYGIRRIDLINFGFHTILIMILYSVIYIVLFKTPMFQTVIGALAACVVTLLGEILNVLLLYLIVGTERTKFIMQNTADADGRLTKAFLGAPTSIFLVIVMFIAYVVLTKMHQKKVEETKNESVEEDS